MKLIVHGGNWQKEVRLAQGDHELIDEDMFQEICYEAGTQAIESFFKYKRGDAEAIMVTKQDEETSLGWVLDVHEKDTENSDRQLAVLTECCLGNAGFHKLAKEQRKEIEQCLRIDIPDGRNEDYERGV